MIIFFLLSLFIFGLCFGSFINVVVYRSNLTTSEESKSLLRHLRGDRKVGLLGGVMGVFGKYGGRSFCPKCKKPIAWFDNIPLVSFVLLRGRCRQCRFPISWQYPLVELITGAAWGAVGYLWLFHLRGFSPEGPLNLGGGFLQLGSFGDLGTFGIMKLLTLPYSLVVVSGLVAILASDLIYMTIPDEVLWVLGATGLTLVLLFHLRGVPQAQPHLGGGLIEVVISGLGAAGVFWLLHRVTKGRGMGFGDVKLALVMGLLLGFPGVVLALFIAFLTGAVVGVILILSGRKRFGQQVAFGPFLVLGTGVVFFGGDQLWPVIEKALLW